MSIRIKFEETIFSYLDQEDTRDFIEFWEDYQSILVAGSKTSYRLKKYLTEKEYLPIKVILTALVRDFNLPAVRYTYAIALMIHAMRFKDSDNATDNTKGIIEAELGLLLRHLQTDDDDEGSTEKERFDRDLELVSRRWNEYLSAPSDFVL